jgi:hypothetical protein
MDSSANIARAAFKVTAHHVEPLVSDECLDAGLMEAALLRWVGLKHRQNWAFLSDRAVELPHAIALLKVWQSAEDLQSERSDVTFLSFA